MEQNKGKLSLMTLISFGGAVFAMHFGGSCMLWPVTWGQQSGSSVFIAMIGIVLTAICLPYAAYIAMLRFGGSFWDMASCINKRFGAVFGCLTIATLGPLFVIPRMSVAALDAICQVFAIANPHPAFVIGFQLLYYIVAYWFMFQKADILNKVGKYLTPILVIAVFAVVVRSLISPMSPMVPKFYTESALQYGLLGGYQSMDLPGSLVFGSIIILNLKATGLEKNALMKNLLVVTAIGFAMLTCSHLSQMLVGAFTGDIYAGVSYAKLYSTVVLDLWGRIGGGIFNVALLLAALTSAVGLGSGCAEFFVEASGQKLDYKKTTIVILALSAVVACTDLDSIVKWTGPILNLIYPPCIVLVLGFIIFARKKMGIVGVATVVAFAWGVIDCITGYAVLFGMDLTGFYALYNKVPLARFGVGWVLPILIGGVLGYICIDRKREETSVPAE